MEEVLKLCSNKPLILVDKGPWYLERTFGEYVSARKMRNMANEMMIKASLYNLFIGTPRNT